MNVLKTAIRWTLAACLVAGWMGCQQQAADKPGREGQCAKDAKCPPGCKCPKCAKAGSPACNPSECPMAKGNFLDKVNGPKGPGWVPLSNGKDMTGWHSMTPNAPMSWKAEGNLLINEKAHGVNIYTDKKFGDFEFYCEYKLPKDGNSGVFLRGLYEVQIKDDFGIPSDKPSDSGNGGIWSLKPTSKNVSKPAGEWQSLYIKLVGYNVTVILNGEKLADNFKLERPTHYYDEMKPIVKPGEPGPILLQGDHKPIEYRNVMIRPIK